MYTIGIDTSHLFLLLVLMDDEKVIGSRQLDCFKQQSEYVIGQLQQLLQENDVTLEQIGSLVITSGPGSYTGVRIAMTVAKVLGSITGKQVYTLSTLQLYAGLSDCYVLMDARARRCYVGSYRNGNPLQPDQVMANTEVAELLKQGRDVIGDLHLFDMQDSYPHLAQNFIDLKNKWQPVENIDYLSPVYLKSKEDYLKQ